MSFKFAFITDTHLYPEAPQNYGGGTQIQESSVEIYETMIQQVEAFEPDFVIHGGDIVCGGDSFEMPPSHYQIALDHAQMMGEQLSAPIYYMPGNHDLDPQNGDKDLYLQRFGYDAQVVEGENQGPDGEQSMSAKRLAYTSLVHDDLRLILLDCQEVEKDVTHGHLGEEQLGWLQTELEQAKAENQEVLIFAHQLLHPTEEFSELGWMIDNSEQVCEIIDRCDHILATFHGHLHLNRILEPDPATDNRRLTIISSGIICYPMMWRKIYVDQDQIRVVSSQLQLPELLAISSAAHDKRGQSLIGEEKDREITIDRRILTTDSSN